MKIQQSLLLSALLISCTPSYVDEAGLQKIADNISGDNEDTDSGIIDADSDQTETGTGTETDIETILHTKDHLGRR